MKVRDVVAGSFDQFNFEKMVEDFRAAQENKIEGRPSKVVEVTAQKFGLRNGEIEGVLTALLQRGEMTQYGLSSAITRASHDVADYDRATKLERLGGQIIELSPSDWREIATAA